MENEEKGTSMEKKYAMMRKWSESLAQAMRSARDAELERLYKTMAETTDNWGGKIINERNNATNYNVALNNKLKNGWRKEKQ